MKAYMYRAAWLCEACGLETRARLDGNDDELPDGPYLDGGGEADSPQHCDACGVFLENALTTDGTDYMLELCNDFLLAGRGHADTIREWAKYYGVRCET